MSEMNNDLRVEIRRLRKTTRFLALGLVLSVVPWLVAAGSFRDRGIIVDDEANVLIRGKLSVTGNCTCSAPTFVVETPQPGQATVLIGELGSRDYYQFEVVKDGGQRFTRSNKHGKDDLTQGWTPQQ